MLKLVVAGDERYRQIMHVGVMRFQYTLSAGEEMRLIEDSDWQGWRKAEIEWDEQDKKIIQKRRQIKDSEKEEGRKIKVNARIFEELPDMLRRQLSWARMLQEAKAIDDASKEEK